MNPPLSSHAEPQPESLCESDAEALAGDRHSDSNPSTDGGSGMAVEAGKGTPLLPGKIPHALLGELLGNLPTTHPALLLGPAVGEDAAVIDFASGSEQLLVAKSDPITFATDEIGYYAVNVCANDLAVTGAIPRFYLPTVLLPGRGSDSEGVRRIFEQIGRACATLGIVVAGGHTEVTDAVNQPVIAGTMLGEVARSRFVSTGGGQPGDLILLCGQVPIEGISILAREMRTELLARGWGREALDAAADYLYRPGISVLPAAQAAQAAGEVTAMHDPTEGGIATGILELALAAGLGVEIDLDAISIPPVGQKLCAEFGLDPLGLIASGALLATCAEATAQAILEAWQQLGRPGAVIGRLTADPARRHATRAGKPVDFPTFQVDELARL